MNDWQFEFESPDGDALVYRFIGCDIFGNHIAHPMTNWWYNTSLQPLEQRKE